MNLYVFVYLQYEYFFENGETPELEDIAGNNLATSSSSSAAGGSLAFTAAQQQEMDQTNMLLHNISKIERLNERELSSSSSNTTTTTRTSRFITNLGKKHAKHSSKSSSANSDGVAVSQKQKSKSFTSSSYSSSTTANAIASAHRLYSYPIQHSITTPPNTPTPFTTYTKNTIKSLYKSTPNISTLTLNSKSLVVPRKKADAVTTTVSSSSSTSSVFTSSTSKLANNTKSGRDKRRPVPTIYDFGVTLRLHFQSSTATASSSSSSSTTLSSSKTTKKKDRVFSHAGFRHERKASLDEKNTLSGVGVGSSGHGKDQQRSSVDISILLTDDESSISRVSDTGKCCIC